MSESFEESPVVLFDGVCNLCNGTVDFIIRRDPSGHFRFGSLQSAAGTSLTDAHGLTTDPPESMIFIDGEGLHLRSEAALGIASRLGGIWKALASVSRIVPRGMRDAIYDWVARNRYGWFGRRSSCRVPSADEAARFIDAGEVPPSSDTAR